MRWCGNWKREWFLVEWDGTRNEIEESNSGKSREPSRSEEMEWWSALALIIEICAFRQNQMWVSTISVTTLSELRIGWIIFTGKMSLVIDIFKLQFIFINIYDSQEKNPRKNISIKVSIFKHIFKMYRHLSELNFKQRQRIIFSFVMYLVYTISIYITIKCNFMSLRVVSIKFIF